MQHILKHGNRFYIKVCPYCNCEFLYQHADVFLNLDSKKGEYISIVNCPECNNVLEADKVPYNEVNNYINSLING